jgi:hypothetical protein
MNREEQIEKEAKRVSYNGDEFNSFIQGAEWADETMIEKMVKWLETINFEKDYIDRDDYGGCFFKEEYFINDFRKAMEE